MTNFLRQLFSESSQASFSRTGSCVALLAACAWVSKIVWATHALPDLEGLVLFISTLYGLGKAGETFQRIATRNATTPDGKGQG